jgi:DNA polymerase III epsilon subunit-like protein
MTILIFDTETTGLIPKNLYITETTINKFPYILQLSWIIYDSKTEETIEKDFIIKCPIDIPQESINIHGITNEMSRNGIEFSNVFDIFLKDVSKCEEIVGHNIQFDLNILEIESYRSNSDKKVDVLFNKNHYDTMLKSVDILKISGTHAGKHKFPRLIEVYRHYFNKDFDNPHNALGDVRATLSIYKKLRNIN